MKSLKPSVASLNENDLSPNCEVLSTFFSTIGSDLNSKFDSNPNFSLIDKVPASMLLLSTNEKEIECILDKLSNKISEDQYGISNKFLKAVKCTIAPSFERPNKPINCRRHLPKLFENSQCCSYTQVRRQERLF